MSYQEPKPEHRNALAQIDDARQRALRAVSELRKREVQSPHPNLTPARRNGESLPVLSTQTVADYLLQLRPYRANSRKWQVDFGTIELPTEIAGSPDGRLGGGASTPLYLCRQPEVPLRNVSQLIEALNMDICYSTNKPSNGSTSSSLEGRRVDGIPGTVHVEYRIDPPNYPGKHEVDEKTYRAIQRGAITLDEAVEMGATDGDAADEDEGYTPAIPSVEKSAGRSRGKSGELKKFKFVFGPDRLLRLVETADEVAAEMDMLAEFEDPDYVSGGGDAA